jgi:HAD superfamily hydrolase (TIGR01509 family)
MEYLGLIFDMDGTLIDSERSYHIAFNRAVLNLGLPQYLDMYLFSVGLRKDLSEELLKEKLGQDYDRVCRVWDEIMSYEKEIILKPGVKTVLNFFRSLKLPMAVATSSHTVYAKERLAQVGILKNFQVVVGGDKVDRPKPFPDIYTKTVALLKIDPRNCVAFEDSPAGTKSAINSGCITIQIPDLLPPDTEMLSLGHKIAPDLVSAVSELGFNIPRQESGT